MLAFFLLGSVYLFRQVAAAPWVYCLLWILLALQLGGPAKSEFLRLAFGRSRAFQLHLVETLLLSFPFQLYLLYEHFWQFALALWPASVAAVFGADSVLVSRVLPTPFRRQPFEFPAGFRKSIWMAPIILFLFFKGIHVGNVNLSLFALAAVYLTTLAFYFSPENPVFVWIHSLDSRSFLFRKVRSAILSSSMLAMPILVVLLGVFPDGILPAAGIVLFGNLLLITVILAKYSAFPKEMGLPQSILFGLSLWFPPLILLVIPLLFRKSVKQLNRILA